MWNELKNAQWKGFVQKCIPLNLNVWKSHKRFWKQQWIYDVSFCPFGDASLDHAFFAKRRFSTNITWNSKTHLKIEWCHHIKSLKKKILNFSSFLCSYLKVQGGRRFSTSKAINKRPFFVRIEYKMAKILFLSIPFQCAPTTFQASSSKMEFGR